MRAVFAVSLAILLTMAASGLWWLATGTTIGNTGAVALGISSGLLAHLIERSV